MKECKKCKLYLDISQFNNQKSKSDGLYPICKKCLSIENLIYKRSYSGTINQMYADMKKRTSHIKYKYWYGKELLSKYDFLEWIINNKDFNILYYKWINNNYNNKIKPSIDRLNSEKGYIISNIRIIELEENRTIARNKRNNNG